MPKKKKLKIVIVTSAIVLIAAAMSVPFFFPLEENSEITNQYTLDINPSFVIGADPDNIVIKLSARNPEGQELIEGFTFEGQSVSSVLMRLIDIMIEHEYLGSSEDNEVLIGYFGQDTEKCLEMLDEEVLQKAQPFCKITVVSDSFDYMAKLEKDGENPAKKKLGEPAPPGNPSTDSPVPSHPAGTPSPGSASPSASPEASPEPTEEAAALEATPEKAKSSGKSQGAEPTPIYDMKAVTVKASTDNTCIKLTWNKINDPNVIGYYVLHSASNPNLTYPGKGYISSTSQNSPAEFTVEPYSYAGTKPGESAYYSIATVYKDLFTKSGNVIKVTMPHNESAPSKNSDVTIEDIRISGYTDGGNLILSWDKSQSKYFSKYWVNCYEGEVNWQTKVFGQYVYGADNITLKVYEGFNSSGSKWQELKAGKTYVFGVKALYYGADGETLESNTRHFTATLPGKNSQAAKPAPKLNNIDFTNYRLKFSFTEDENANLDKYVICYSKSDSTPTYGDYDVKKLAEFSQYSANAGSSYSIEDLDYGTKYYFSVTSLYSDGTKKASNTLSFTTPQRFIATASAHTDSTKSNIIFNWNTCADPQILGYLIVVSKKTPNPTRATAASEFYISGASSSTFSFPLPLNLSEPRTYHFSLLTYYKYNRVFQGNSITMTVVEDTPTPQPTAAATPSPSATDAPTPSPEETDTPEPTPSPTEEITPEPSEEITPSPSASKEATVETGGT